MSRHGLHGGSCVDREARVGQHLLGTGGAHHRPQHGPRRVERRRAVQRHEIERGGVDDRRPSLRLGGLPGQHRDPAGQHGQRGVLLDARRRRAPASQRCTVDMLAGLVGRQDQRRHQLDAAVPLGRVQQVLERPCAGDPLDSYQSAARRCSLGIDVGLDPAKLAEQELPEQRVVAVPLPPTVERDQEQARRLELAQLLAARRLRRAARRTAARTAGRAPPCAAGTAGCSPGSCVSDSRYR